MSWFRYKLLSLRVHLSPICLQDPVEGIRLQLRSQLFRYVALVQQRVGRRSWNGFLLSLPHHIISGFFTSGKKTKGDTRRVCALAEHRANSTTPGVLVIVPGHCIG